MDIIIQDGVRDLFVEWGIGIGFDVDVGWVKVWRFVCWVCLNDIEKVYFELRYVIDRNFVVNGFSMYLVFNFLFQIDVNFGFGGVVFSMLVVDFLFLFYVEIKDVWIVVLGFVILSLWVGGRVRGFWIWGGGIVDFFWDDEGFVIKVCCWGLKICVWFVNKEGEVLVKVQENLRIVQCQKNG